MTHRTVDGVTAVIGAGQVTAFAGPNGAGETTTLRMLLGLVAPTSCTATFLVEPRRYRILVAKGVAWSSPASSSPGRRSSSRSPSASR